MGSPSWQRLHLVVGVIAIIVFPALSWLDGSGQLAWTMFSRTGHYRLELTADGKPVNPTELAAAAAPGPTSMALTGADHFRHHDVWRATFHRDLDDIAKLVCRLRPGSRVVARLEERVRTTAAIGTSEVTVQCAR